MKILGISAYYHDSAAVLIEHGEIIAAAQEERFSRIKHDESFPIEAIKYCLGEAVIDINDLDAVVFYDKPFLKFERILETYMNNAPKGWWQFIKAMPAWLKEKLFIKEKLKSELKEIGEIDWKRTDLLFSKHHLSHASSAFYTSSYSDAAILSIDGVGEWATASIAYGEVSSIKTLKELHFPDSLGLLYSAFTYFLGFKVNEGEYKVMGLAPYGDRNAQQVQNFVALIKQEIITVFDDGSIKLNQDYFAYATSFKMIDETAFKKLFGFAKRTENEAILQTHFELAAALQIIVEEVVVKMAKEAQKLTGSKNICLSGGVALNCVANGALQEQNIFDNIYVQPASGDAGGALGAALAAYHLHYKKERKLFFPDAMKNAKLGPKYSDVAIERALTNNQLVFEKMSHEDLVEFIATKIVQGNVIGWFQGRMEFGPRALGSRSILGNPLLKETQSVLNLKVKKRESFRPFAPLMLEEEFEKYFSKTYSSPYMLMVHKIKVEYRLQTEESKDLTKKINQIRSVIPAISHVDYSSRIQTVNQQFDDKMFDLLNAFKEKTGIGVLVNTSFNVKGEPIVCSPQNAIACFLSTDIDILVLENYVILKNNN